VRMFCIRFEVCCVLCFLQVLSRITPGFFRGPSWLSPTRVTLDTISTIYTCSCT
jgi:hypothetical protein